MKKGICVLLIVMALCITPGLHSQVPDLEQKVDITSSVGATGTVVADGYGIHSITIVGGVPTHRLLGSDGKIENGYTSTLNVLNPSSLQMTSFGGKLRVVMIEGNNLRLRESTNGGQSWSALASYAASTLSGKTIHVHSDAYGTHVVWSVSNPNSPGEIYYVRHRSVPDLWEFFQHVTDLSSSNSGTGSSARVVTARDKIVVVYRNAATSGFISSRDATIGTSSDTWDISYREFPSTIYINSVTSVASIGNTVYATLKSFDFGLDQGTTTLASRDVSGN